MSQFNFHVGQKVVCVDDGSPQPPPNPEFGGVYTISRIFMDGFDVMVDLVELPHAGSEGFQPGYFAAAFRPVVPRKTSIKIFTDILKEVEAKEPVEGLPSMTPSFEHTGYSLIPPGCTVFMPAFFARVRAQRVCGNASEIGKFRTQTAAPIIQSTRQPARPVCSIIGRRLPLQAGTWDVSRLTGNLSRFIGGFDKPAKHIRCRRSNRLENLVAAVIHADQLSMEQTGCRTQSLGTWYP